MLKNIIIPIYFDKNMFKNILIRLKKNADIISIFQQYPY